MDEDRVSLLYWIDGGWCFEHDFANLQNKRYKRNDAFEVMVEWFVSDEDIIDIVEWKLKGDNIKKKVDEFSNPMKIFFDLIVVGLAILTINVIFM